MSKDRTQPYWGLTKDFCFAVSRIGNPSEDEWGDYYFREFLAGLGGLIQTHANLNRGSSVMYKMLLEQSDPKNQYLIRRCHYDDIVNLVDPSFGSIFSVDRNSTFSFEEVFSANDYHYETTEVNPLKNNLIYKYALREMEQVSKYWPFDLSDIPEGLYVEDYWPRPWKNYTLCSIGLSMPGKYIYKMEFAPAKITVLPIKEYDKLVSKLEDSYIDLEEICTHKDYEGQDF